MSRRRPLLDRPQETLFFTFVGGFGLVLAAIYWFLTYEVAGTVLLLGFGIGAGLIGIALLRASTGGTRDADTPFDDPSGRLPGESLAPLSLGLGVALALTAIVFGPWLLVAGMLPAAWGAWTWLSGARAELDATADHEG